MNEYIYENKIISNEICDIILKLMDKEILNSDIMTDIQIELPLYPDETDEYYPIINSLTNIISENIKVYLNNIEYNNYYETLIQTTMTIYISRKKQDNAEFKNELNIFNKYNSYIVCIIFLNDSDDGTIEFWNGYKVMPEKGKLLLFPATWDFIFKHNYSKKTDNYYIKTILYEY